MYEKTEVEQRRQDFRYVTNKTAKQNFDLNTCLGFVYLLSARIKLTCYEKTEYTELLWKTTPHCLHFLHPLLKNSKRKSSRPLKTSQIEDDSAK